MSLLTLHTQVQKRNSLITDIINLVKWLTGKQIILWNKSTEKLVVSLLDTEIKGL